MKIAFPCFVLDHGKSGIATYIIKLLHALQEIDEKNIYNVYLSSLDVSLLHLHKKNFHTHVYPNYFLNPLINIFWQNFIFPLSEKNKNYDLLHIPSIRRIPYAKRCPIIATVHDLAAFTTDKKYDMFRNFYHRSILKRLIYRCDHIVTPSVYTKDSIVKYTGYPEEMISVVYPGIDKQLFYQMDLQQAKDKIYKKYHIKDPFFVYVSRIEHPGKNHLRLIQAFEHFKKQTKRPHQLVIIGADWKGADIVKRYASESFVSKEIHFLGFIPSHDIKAFYSACDLMVFPSLYEGFGFPVVEALACGAPVICSNIGPLKEIAGQLCITFDPEQVIDISKAMDKGLVFLNKKEKRQERIAYVEKFDWKKTAQKMLDIYQLVFSLKGNKKEVAL